MPRKIEPAYILLDDIEHSIEEKYGEKYLYVEESSFDLFVQRVRKQERMMLHERKGWANI